MTAVCRGRGGNPRHHRLACALVWEVGYMSEALASAGTTGYLVLVGALVGLVVCGVAATYAMRRRRLPLTALMLVPMILLALGSLGSWMALLEAAQAAASAEPTQIPV